MQNNEALEAFDAACECWATKRIPHLSEHHHKLIRSALQNDGAPNENMVEFLTTVKTALEKLDSAFLDEIYSGEESFREIVQSAIATTSVILNNPGIFIKPQNDGALVEALRENIGKAIYAYNFAPSHEYTCQRCGGSGREEDDTPCSNPNEEPLCIVCNGRGNGFTPATQQEKIDAAMKVLTDALQSQPAPVGKWQRIETVRAQLEEKLINARSRFKREKKMDDIELRLISEGMIEAFEEALALLPAPPADDEVG